MTRTSSQKGKSLELAFLEYLKGQFDREVLVFGIYPAKLCQVRHRPKYYCQERERDIEFDIAIEVSRDGASAPHLFVIFECKNYKDNVPETDITDFSDKLSRIRKHNAKGILVTSSGLQSGARNLATKRGLGIVRYDANGADVVAERAGGCNFSKNQIYPHLDSSRRPVRSLKFAAILDAKPFVTIGDLLVSIDPYHEKSEKRAKKLSHISTDEISNLASKVRELTGYIDGLVDLHAACRALGIKLEPAGEVPEIGGSDDLLGRANFSEGSIQIFEHDNEFRERFTIAHEIGHFALNHGTYLYSDSVSAEHPIDLNNKETGPTLNRLEAQANVFAAELLLPAQQLRKKVLSLSEKYDFSDRGHGLIFVDDQPWNYVPYNEFIGELKTFFGVSKAVIEIKLKRWEILNDQRNSNWKKVSFGRLT